MSRAKSKQMNFTLPTIWKATSGSGTYNTPAGVKYLRVRMVGGGASGSGNSGGGSGSAGFNTTFQVFAGPSFLIANGGSATGPGTGGIAGGGSYSLPAPAIGTGIVGQSGSSGFDTRAVVYTPGGFGGSTPMGGGGMPSIFSPGQAGVTNSGGGGAGGGTAPAGGTSGSGGGGGGFIDAIILSPSPSYTYVVASAQTTVGGAGPSGSAGGAGAAGYIEITEYYQ